MQTFLPHPDFHKTASVLDWRRLGKQRVEAQQILNTLRGLRAGWAAHPAVVMWRGYERALEEYRNTCILEWLRRGYKNSMSTQTSADPIVLPPWLGDNAFHASHRSNLLRKDVVHYSQFGWEEPADLPYIWPCQVSVLPAQRKRRQAQ